MSAEVIPSSTLSPLPPAAGRARVLLCLHSAPGFIGALIRWQQRGDYSHASLLFPGMGVIESREFCGVRSLPELQPKKGERIDVFEVAGVTATQEQEIFEFAQRQLGKPYDYTMVARFVSRRDAARKESGKWFCSELAYAAYRKAGVFLFRATESWEVSPGLLARGPLLTRRPDLSIP